MTPGCSSHLQGTFESAVLLFELLDFSLALFLFGLQTLLSSFAQLEVGGQAVALFFEGLLLTPGRSGRLGGSLKLFIQVFYLCLQRRGDFYLLLKP